ncbi:MAG: PocR ligand-binding domain-containing protein [Clostridia bacterium]|nr:PocR ligand-binding domain-containing protein [Clostridia bacterium]
MPLTLKNDELLDLMKDFYTLTGIRFVLFDECYQEILAYPEAGTPFCSFMRKNADFDRCCRESDRIAFETCRGTKELTVYECHAGLIEATAPLTENGTIIGYIMFGQIADKGGKDAFLARLCDYCRNFTDEDTLRALTPKIRYKEKKQVSAAAKILDACTGYILLKEMVSPSRQKLFEELDAYVSGHLSENLTMESLCRIFGISRTRLYEAIKPYAHDGIALWIKGKRLEAAKRYLAETDMSISEISEAVGFADYTYFLRVFRKVTGISPKAYRKEHHS